MRLKEPAAPWSMSIWEAEMEWYGINKLYFFSKHHEYIFLTSFMVFFGFWFFFSKKHEDKFIDSSWANYWNSFSVAESFP